MQNQSTSRRFAQGKRPRIGVWKTHQWPCTGTISALSWQHIVRAQPLRSFVYVRLHGSFVHRVWRRTSSWVSPLETCSVCIWCDTSFQSNGYSRTDAFGATALSSQGRITTSHIGDELNFRFCMLVGMMLRTLRLGLEELDGSIVADQPEVDIGTASVVLSARLAFPMILQVCH